MREVLDRFLQRALVLAFFASLVYVALDPFGYAVFIPLPPDRMGRVGVASLHKLTVLGCLFVACFLYIKMSKVPLLKRLGLILLFGWIAYNSYDVIWNLDFQLLLWGGFTLTPFLEGLYRIAFQYLPPVFFAKVFVHSLKIQLRMIVVLFLLDMASIGWLESTGFFVLFIYWNHSFGIGGDPHNWVWFIGKLASFLAFPLVFMNLDQLRARARKELVT